MHLGHLSSCVVLAPTLIINQSVSKSYLPADQNSPNLQFPPYSDVNVDVCVYEADAHVNVTNVYAPQPNSSDCANLHVPRDVYGLR